jgi:hypothetical protein
MLPIEPSKGLKYNFAHLTLPILVLMNPKKFYQDITDSNGDRYLQKLWHGLAERMVLRQPSFGLNLSLHKLDENMEAVIIELPAPKEVTEAFLVSAVFKFKNMPLSREIEYVRYFTLELGENPFNKSNEYHFCEWTGTIISSRQHENYGKLPEQSIACFKSAIIDLLGIDVKLPEAAIPRPNMNKPEQVDNRKQFDEMSDLEQKQFVVDKLLPKMEEIAQQRLADNENVKDKTMAYIEQAVKERNRSIAVRQIIIAIIAMGIGICATFACVMLFYLNTR